MKVRNKCAVVRLRRCEVRMKVWGVVILVVLSGCVRASKPTILEAKSNKPSKEVFECVMARASMDGYVPTNGGANDSFLELVRGEENLASTLITGKDMSYNEGITVMASGGLYRMQVYRTNANATNNSVRYEATDSQRAYAEGVWSECTASREECLEIQSDYQQCLDRGGVDPTK